MSDLAKEVNVKRFVDLQGREHACRRDAALASLAYRFGDDSADGGFDVEPAQIHNVHDLLSLLAEFYPFSGDFCEQFAEHYGEAFNADMEDDTPL